MYILKFWFLRFLADHTAIHGMIGYWHHPVVRPSFYLSVCLWRCALWLSGSVYTAKSYTSVTVFLAGMFLFVPSDTFCRMYRLATKRIAKNEVRNAIRIYGLRLHATIGVENARLVCQQWHRAVKRACCVQHFSRGVRTVACGYRSAIIVGSANWQRMDFLFRGRDVAITMNSVKILHVIGYHSNSWASCISVAYVTLNKLFAVFLYIIPGLVRTVTDCAVLLAIFAYLASRVSYMVELVK